MTPSMIFQLGLMTLLLAALLVMAVVLIRGMKLLETRDRNLIEQMDKMLGLVAAKGPLEFQAIQAVSSTLLSEDVVPHDPSDEGEWLRSNPEGRLDDFDRDIIESIPGFR
jgi:hypothetical protein